MAGYRFVVYEDKRGEFRWQFVSPNGQIMATPGEGYTSRYNCEKAIETIQREAASAKIE